MSSDTVDLVAQLREAADPTDPLRDVPWWWDAPDRGGPAQLLRAAADALERDHAIVADLAELECPVDRIVSYVTGEVDGLCPTCYATLASDTPHLIEPHESDCVWVRAREAVGGEG